MMKTAISNITDSFLHLFFPHICSGCGSDLVNKQSSLCLRCIEALPETNFELHANNPVENMFRGRLPVMAATAQYYFSKESLVQRLLHLFKYKRDKELGLQLGKMMGEQLLRSGRFTINAIVPLPLFPAREKRRGYNQSAILASGIKESLKVPFLQNAVTRPHQTETQTKKGRIERWKNMEGKFVLADAALLAGKHILLVDDVITTGATLEACGTEILKAPGSRLSIATLCVASR